ncbi:CheY-like superfamily [Nitzschia inconspicua]|uniref:CheY-like superfamily n=1 Tax=Nitzschia inconspicua TaxID=303405 RepID=A0A9K3P7U6_9STRA|nr:two-component response regulator [Nitzschia inconspicua]KAG7372965.1 CheY-like superfamily [Nitzschia inconspicua]
MMMIRDSNKSTDKTTETTTTTTTTTTDTETTTEAIDSIKEDAWIVLVDDEESIRSAVSQLFLMNGYKHVTTCQNGQEVLDLLLKLQQDQQDQKQQQQQQPPVDDDLPDCIVCDVRMPIMDGLQLLKQVRQNDQWVTIPFILLTAKGSVSDRIQGYDCGADAYLSKPFQPTELLAIVENLLLRNQRRKQQQQQSQQLQSSNTVTTKSVDIQDLYDELNQIKDLLLYKGGGGVGNGWVIATPAASTTTNTNTATTATTTTSTTATTPDATTTRTTTETNQDDVDDDDDADADGVDLVVFSTEEQSILELLCDGRMTKEIAASRHVSVRRIEQLLTQMFRKTNTKNRTELVKWAVSNGHVE